MLPIAMNQPLSSSVDLPSASKRGARLPRGVIDGRSVGLPHQAQEATATERKDANAMILTGVGIGAFGAVSAAVIGATCPLCVVAAPALVGWGVFKRVRARRR
jgi:hypothetical protein